MQFVKHMVRLEVEKSIFTLIENEPELKAVNDKLKSEQLELMKASDHFVNDDNVNQSEVVADN